MSKTREIKPSLREFEAMLASEEKVNAQFTCMSKQLDIKTYPDTVNWLFCMPLLLIATGIASVPLLMILDYLYLHSSTGRVPTIGIVTSVGFGAFVGAWFTWKMYNRFFWRLTQTELIWGIRGKMKLPLSSLTKIVIGLPNKFAIPGLEKIAPPQIRAASILLCFSDYSLLPMHLHGIPNGSRLMNELISRFPERVDQHYTYSQDEIKILRKADINVLIARKNVALPN